jgi:hypothetical protein
VSVRQEPDGTIVLEGRCEVEDAEPLLQLMQAAPDARCDWTRCSHLHTAVVQVVMAANPALVGPCGDPWIEQWVEPILGRSARTLLPDPAAPS